MFECTRQKHKISVLIIYIMQIEHYMHLYSPQLFILFEINLDQCTGTKNPKLYNIQTIFLFYF